MTIPPVLLDLLRASLSGDWYGNLILGLGIVVVMALLVCVGALARER